MAAGEQLPFRQEDVRQQGAAIECRINAEDPEKNFRPTPGTITRFRVPGGFGVRFDSHVHEGYVVSPYYDSMIGKLIVHQPTRREAIASMKRALGELHIEGVKTTIPLHQKILDHTAFHEARVDTTFITPPSSSGPGRVRDESRVRRRRGYDRLRTRHGRHRRRAGRGATAAAGWQIVALAASPPSAGFRRPDDPLGLHLRRRASRLGAQSAGGGPGRGGCGRSGLRTGAPTRVQRWLAKRGILPLEAKANSPHPSPLPKGEGIGNCPLPKGEGTDFPAPELALWLAVGVLAAYSHLLVDVFFSAGKGQPVWGVPLCWPFSNAAWAYPLVPWGDVGATVIFAAGTCCRRRQSPL